MPDTRQHRGRHPSDERLFAAGHHDTLASAVFELSWLLSRGYNDTAALKLVGDRHGLRARQRKAVASCSCSEDQRERREAHRAAGAQLRGATVEVDGFNALILVESALSGGVILRGRDTAHRDLASVHSTYRAVSETDRAIELLGERLAELGVLRTRLCLDRPVSNSGRLRRRIEQIAERHGWRWEVALLPDPDSVLADSSGIVASADSWILDRCKRWYDLAGAVVHSSVPSAWMVDLGGMSRSDEGPGGGR